MHTVRIEPFAGEWLQGVVAVLQAALHADPISPSLFVRKVLLDPNFEPEGARVALRGERVVGFGLALARRTPLEDAPPDTDRGYLTLMGVHPDYQRQGIGTRLLEQLEDFLRARARRVVLVSPYAPHYFLPGIDIHAYAGALAFFQRHGYQEVYRPLAMSCNLWQLRIPDWVREREQVLRQEGVVVEPYRAELLLPLMRFLKAEFAGDWQRVAREAIARIETGENPQRLYLAHQQGEVLGFSHFENERFGPIGVARAQRGRGIGQVLMFHTLQAMRQQGLHTAYFLWSDDRTAERLYHAAGFVEARRFAVLRKEL